MNQPKINLISEKKANLIVSAWIIDPTVNKELYLANCKEGYVAIDNTSGDCFTEDFSTIEEAISWILDK